MIKTTIIGKKIADFYLCTPSSCITACLSDELCLFTIFSCISCGKLFLALFPFSALFRGFLLKSGSCTGISSKFPPRGPVGLGLSGSAAPVRVRVR